MTISRPWSSSAEPDNVPSWHGGGSTGVQPHRDWIQALVMVARRSNVQYVERAPERTKTKTALMIAGSAATGAGVGGALKGTKGALIGAAVGGGAASIYEAAKRR